MMFKSICVPSLAYTYNFDSFFTFTIKFSYSKNNIFYILSYCTNFSKYNLSHYFITSLNLDKSLWNTVLRSS